MFLLFVFVLFDDFTDYKSFRSSYIDKSSAANDGRFTNSESVKG